MTVCNIQTPATEAEAKFSVRHTVALAMAGKDTAANASFEPEAVGDPYLRAWSERINVYSDPGLSRANARVEVLLTSGERTVSTFDASCPATDLAAQEARLLNTSAVLFRKSAIYNRSLEIGIESGWGRGCK